MHTNVRRGLLGTLFAGGLLALGTTAAYAADTTSGNDSTGSGTQVIAPVTAPVTLGATSIGLPGDSTATNGGSAAATTPAAAPSTGGNNTSGDESLASGTQATAPATAPVTLGATSIGLPGDSAAATGAPEEPGTDGAATPPGSNPGGGASGGASGPGTASGAQCTAQTVGFAPAGHGAPLTDPGAGTLAWGANNGANLAALALLCGGALLKLRRRSA